MSSLSSSTRESSIAADLLGLYIGIAAVAVMGAVAGGSITPSDLRDWRAGVLIQGASNVG